MSRPDMNGQSSMQSAATVMKEDREESASDNRAPNLLIGVSGSVAAIKLEELAEELSKFANIKIVTTAAAKHFLDKDGKWASQAIDDESEWHLWREKGDPVQHIELSKWADVLLIAPLSANTMAKIAQGFCDNLLTCIVRAWDTASEKKLVLVPAMNTKMWNNPMTSRHLKEINDCYGAIIIWPMEKQLACGDFGVGAMASVSEIVLTLRICLKGAKPSVLPQNNCKPQVCPT